MKLPSFYRNGVRLILMYTTPQSSSRVLTASHKIGMENKQELWWRPKGFWGCPCAKRNTADCSWNGLRCLCLRLTSHRWVSYLMVKINGFCSSNNLPEYCWRRHQNWNKVILQQLFLQPFIFWNAHSVKSNSHWPVWWEWFSCFKTLSQSGKHLLEEKRICGASTIWRSAVSYYNVDWDVSVAQGRDFIFCWLVLVLMHFNFHDCIRSSVWFITDVGKLEPAG